jgi:molybdate transport system substrate-binding protein
MRFALVLLLALVACSSSEAEEKRVRVFASASLAESFRILGTDYAVRYPEAAPIELHTAGTPQLVTQILEGVDVDVFACADQQSMARVDSVREHAAMPFAVNSLVIALAEGNPQSIAGLPDLAREDLLVALCGPEVPAGRYARTILARANVKVNSVSDEPNVNSLLSKVKLGELDAGLVYLTDVWQGPVDFVDVPPLIQVRAIYPIAAMRSGAGEHFVEYVLSEAGQAILAELHFEAP